MATPQEKERFGKRYLDGVYGRLWIIRVCFCVLKLGININNYCIYCDGPVAVTGLVYMKIRTTIRGLEVKQTFGGFSSPSNSERPTENGKRS